jgi:hypothetical protein
MSEYMHKSCEYCGSEFFGSSDEDRDRCCSKSCSLRLANEKKRLSRAFIYRSGGRLYSYIHSAVPIDREPDSFEFMEGQQV